MAEFSSSTSTSTSTSTTYSPPPPLDLPPFSDRFHDIPEPIRTQIIDACTQIMQQHRLELITEEAAKQEVEKEYEALMLVEGQAAKGRKRAEWWAKVKREREEDEAREFKRCRYALRDYMRQLEEGEGYRLRPYWWADFFVDDEEDDKVIEIYD